MNEFRLLDLSVLNIEKKFSENLDLNSVVDTFAKMGNKSKQLVAYTFIMYMYVQLSIAICLKQ